MEATLQVLEAIGQRLFGFAGEDRLVDLDMAAAGPGQRQQFRIDRRGQIRAEFGVVVIEGIRHRVGNRHRARHRHLDRAVGEGLGRLPVMRQEMPARGDRAGDVASRP